ncbi:MAG: ANTAR domain-containing protein [Thiobacillaceae bacterium]|nr:ANTAR domain-containing protein [Thiobacillaceae bacterium]MCX7672880.1 ANTAR domain-containing protein [Thiobacillaceae bacterium]MDW8324270.1 ANTAR domain-containing protein [Burkholderiales bacterium]
MTAKNAAAEPIPALEVLVVDRNAQRGRELRAALSLAGYTVQAVLRDMRALHARVLELKPQVIIIAADSPDRDTLEHIAATLEDAPRPVVMFTQDDADESIRAAIEAGVSAYVVDGLDPTRLSAILKVAQARFEAHQGLKRRLAEAERRLAERQLVERAKGLLMEKKGLSEEAAYRELRRLSMDTGRRLAEVAQTLIAARDLL